jgi:L-asparaginase
MLNHPDLVAGEGRFDTELMRLGHGQVLSKGGAEGIQCLSRVGEGMGVAIKVDDGARRAKQAVALHLLEQLEWLTPTTLEELRQRYLTPADHLRLEVIGASCASTGPVPEAGASTDTLSWCDADIRRSTCATRGRAVW